MKVSKSQVKTDSIFINNLGTLNNNQGPFFMGNSQLIHELIVSESYTKDIEEQQNRYKNIKF